MLAQQTFEITPVHPRSAGHLTDVVVKELQLREQVIALKGIDYLLLGFAKHGSGMGCLLTGVDRFVAKPFAEDELLAQIEALLVPSVDA